MNKTILLGIFAASMCALQLSTAQTAPSSPAARPQGILNVITDCGVKADGVTDDSKAINDCFETYPGRTFFFPAATYFAASDIIQKGHGTIARGEGMPSSNTRMTGTAIKFGPGAGWKIGTPDSRKDDCHDCVLEDLGVIGPANYDVHNASTCVIPSMDGRGRSYGNGLASSQDLTDGVSIDANLVTVRNVRSGAFARYGFRCNGNSSAGAGGGRCNHSSIEDTLAYGNRGSGYFVSGGDSNAGELIEARSYFAQMWGFELYPFLGMLTIARSAHTNHVTLTKPGPLAPIQEIRGEGNSATLLTAQPLKGVGVGNIVILSGTNGWNGSYSVTDYDKNHTYSLKSLRAAPSVETSGSARLATCDEAWEATGTDGGSVKNNAGAVTSVELGSYNEADSGAGATSGGAAKYNPTQSIVIGGDQGPGFDVADGFAPAAWLTADLGGFEVFGGAGFRSFVDNKHYGDNKITLGKGFGDREQNNSFLKLQDMTGAATPNFAAELRKAISGNSSWFGFRTHLSSDAAGLSNYPFLFGYGATRESCLPSETAPNCSRPMTWFPNGFWIGNSVDGARISYGETTAGKPADSVGNPGDWLLNANPGAADCAAWVKISDGDGAWRCIPLEARQSDLGKAQMASPSAASASQLPACDAAHRGQYQFTPGDRGVKDTFQVCAKDASEHYAWRVLY